MKEEKEKKKNVWNYILIVVVILGIIVGYLSYLQDKKMDKMEEELDKKRWNKKTLTHKSSSQLFHFSKH